MKTTVAIYLAGTIKKAHESPDETYWTNEDMQFLRQRLNHYELSFLNPALRTDDLSNQFSVFGRDMLQVFSSDIVFVDARNRRGLGVGAEMMWAKLNRIPVITLAPKDSHYNKSKTSLLDVEVENWIHPFVESLSDAIVEDLAEGAEWIQKLKSQDSIEVKGVDYIASAMRYYASNQLHNDQPMQSLREQNDDLNQRIKNICMDLPLDPDCYLIKS